MKKCTSTVKYALASLAFDVALTIWTIVINVSFLDKDSAFVEKVILVAPSVAAICLGYIARLLIFRKGVDQIGIAITYIPLLLAFLITPLVVIGPDAFELSFFIGVLTTVMAEFGGYFIASFVADFCDYDNNQYPFPPI